MGFPGGHLCRGRRRSLGQLAAGGNGQDSELAITLVASDVLGM